MNVFYTNDCPIQAANEHVRIHQVKMIVEYTQLLSTAIRLYEGKLCKVWVKRVSNIKLEDGTKIKKVKCKQVDWYELPSDTFEFRFGRRWLVDKVVYAHTHVNHPSAIWVRQSYDHYIWVWECAKKLCELYSTRTGRSHKTEGILDIIAAAPKSIPENGFVRPPVAAGEEFITMSSVVGVCKAYQAYLCDKFQEWKSRAKPLKVEFDFVPAWYS